MNLMSIAFDPLSREWGDARVVAAGKFPALTRSPDGAIVGAWSGGPPIPVSLSRGSRSPLLGKHDSAIRLAHELLTEHWSASLGELNFVTPHAWSGLWLGRFDGAGACVSHVGPLGLPPEQASFLKLSLGTTRGRLVWELGEDDSGTAARLLVSREMRRA